MKRINLLPIHKQSELYYEDLYHSVSVAAVLGVLILLLGVVAQVAVWFYLDAKEKSVTIEVDTLKQQIDRTENAQLKQEIKLINNQMVDFESLSKLTPKWSAVLTAFAKQIPADVRISSFTAEVKTGKIEISGYSPTRELVIELYNNINSDKEHFRDIDYPLENVAKPTEVNFNYSFFIQDGILVPKK